MATTKVSEALARPIRGVGQTGAGLLVTELIDSTIWDMNDKQFGLVVLILGGLISFAQNAIENYLGKAVLRDVPPKEVPVIDNDTPEAVEGE